MGQNESQRNNKVPIISHEEDKSVCYKFPLLGRRGDAFHQLTAATTQTLLSRV